MDGAVARGGARAVAKDAILNNGCSEYPVGGGEVIGEPLHDHRGAAERQVWAAALAASDGHDEARVLAHEGGRAGR
jgi:hypothetical protein